MHVIARPTLIEFWTKHLDSELPLKIWFNKVRKANWKNLNEIKKEFPSADYVDDNRMVFDIKGNKYRLVVLIFFDGQKAYIRFVGTQAEYDKINATKI